MSGIVGIKAEVAALKGRTQRNAFETGCFTAICLGGSIFSQPMPDWVTVVLTASALLGGALTASHAQIFLDAGAMEQDCETLIREMALSA